MSMIVEASSNALRVQLNFCPSLSYLPPRRRLNYWIRFRYLNTYSRLKNALVNPIQMNFIRMSTARTTTRIPQLPR